MLYVGVDLHRKQSHVAVLDEEGEQLANRRVRGNEPEEFFRIFGEFEPEHFKVAFEATYGWSWFADMLADAGIESHMAHPLACKAIASARVKNDSVDAKTLAHLLRTNLLPEAWIAPHEIREARRLVRSRCSLQRIASRCKVQVWAILADYRVSLPITDAFGKAGRLALAAIELPPIPAERIRALLRLIDTVGCEVRDAECQMRSLLRDDPAIRRLLPIPGIGFLTAATIATEIGDVTRFASADRLCSWAGLTPSEHSSAESTRRGHITKQGSRWMRWALVESAAKPALKDPDLRQFHDRIARRRGKKIARVALARRLTQLCFYAIRSEGGCKAYPVTE
ncbi:MAG: IS110 family RNA-guided transposase [Actinomycetota bacterium]